MIQTSRLLLLNLPILEAAATAAAATFHLPAAVEEALPVEVAEVVPE